MTRTQKLGLCTWLPEDAVCLAEVNENFSKLDENGGRALELAREAMVDLGGLMAAQAHQGCHASYAQNIMADAFQDASNLDSYEQVYYLGKSLSLLSTGLASGSVSGGTNVTSGGGSYGASDVHRQTQTKKAWCKLFDFYPDAYGKLTNLKLQTSDTCTSSKSASVKLSIWDGATGEMLLETELGTISMKSSEDGPVNFTTDLLLDPNHSYTMKVWIDSMPNSSLWLSSLAFTVTPVIYTSGSATMQPFTLPAGCARAVLLVHGTSAAPQPALSFDGDEFTSFEDGTSAPDVLPGGSGCTLWRFEMALPSGAQNAALRFLLPSSGCAVYDFALIAL